MSLKINDTVKVISGDHKGAEAKIVGVDRKTGKAMLEGIGLVERHMKRTQYNPQGGKKTIHLGIDMSNLSLVKAGETKKPVKSGVKKLDKTDAGKAAKADEKAKKGAK